MKTFLLSLFVAISTIGFTQDLEYYRDLLPDSDDFKIEDAQNDISGNTYLLIRFTGSHSIPDFHAHDIVSPVGKYALAVLCYEKNGNCNGAITIVAESMASSSSEVSNLAFVKTKRGLAITGSKTIGSLTIKGSSSLLTSTNDKGIFFTYLRNVASTGSCDHKDYTINFLKVYPNTSTSIIETIKQYSYNETDEYFIFAGSFKGNLTIGSTTLTASSTGTIETPFISKIHINGTTTPVYSVTYAQKLNISNTVSGSYGRIKDLAINNSTIVVFGDFKGTLETNPTSTLSSFNVVSNTEKSAFIAQYPRSTSSLTHTAQYKLIDGSGDYYRVELESDNNNFYLSYAIYLGVPGFDIDFKSGASVNPGTFTRFVAKYNSDLDYQWHINMGISGRIKMNIGFDNDNNLCLLSNFMHTKNFNPNGTVTNYTANAWTEDSPTNYFLGKYNNSDGTLITGNTMQLTGNGANEYKIFLGTNPESSKMSIVSFGKKIDYDLGHGEDIVSHASKYYFVSTYNECTKTTIGTNFNRTVCEGTQLTSSYVSASGTGNIIYRWYKDGVALQNGTFNEGLITQTNTSQLKINNITPDAEGAYKIEALSSCDISRFSNVVNYAVNNIARITSQPVGNIVCENTSTSFSVSAVSTSSYQWQVNNGNGGFSDIPNGSPYSGVDASVLNISSANIGMAGYEYRCEIIGEASCNTIYSEIVNLGINPNPNIQTQPINNSVCIDATANFSISTSGSGLNFQWQRSSNGGSSFTNISNSSFYAGAQSSSLTVSNLNSGFNNYEYRCIVSGTCGSSITSNSAVLTVNELAQLTNSTGDITECEYENIAYSVNTSGHNLTFLWQVDDGSGWSNLNNNFVYNNVTSPNLEVSSIEASLSGNSYRCLINSGCSSTIYSTPANLTVSQTPDITVNSSDGTDICQGDNSQLTISGGDAAYIYQWKRNFSPITNASNNNLTVTQSGVYSLYAENTTGCSSETDPVTINVHAVPNANITTIGNTNLCDGEYSELTVPSGNGYSFQWYNNSSPIAGAVSNAIIINETGNYHVIVNNTFSCQSSSATETVTVNPLPTVSLSPTNIDLCEGSTQLLSATNNANYSYQWKQNNVNLSGENSSGITVSSNGIYNVDVINTTTGCEFSSDYVNSSVSANTTITGHPSNNMACENNGATFNVSATGAAVSYEWKESTDGGTTWQLVNNGGDYTGADFSALSITNLTPSQTGYLYKCDISGICGTASTSNVASLTVRELANLVSSPSSETACENQNVTYSINASGDDLAFQWEVFEGSSWVNLNNGGRYAGVTNLSLDISSVTGSMSGYQYRCVISSACSANIYSNAADLTVSPTPNITINSSNGTNICQTENTALTINGGDVNYSYQWKRNYASISGASTDNLSVSQSGIYSIYANDPSGCSAESEPITINVHAIPDATITLIGNAEFCQGGTVELMVPSGNGNTYQWYNNGNLLSNISNSLITSESGIFNVEISSIYGCETISNTETVTVNPLPTVALSETNIELCQGQNETISTNDNTNNIYQWKKNNLNISGANQNSIVINENGLYNVYVLNSQTGCENISEYASVLVNPLPSPELFASADLIYCVDDQVELSLIQTYQAYLWEDLSTSSTLSITDAGTYNVTVTDGNTCQNNTEIVVMENLVATPNICMVTVDTTINKNLIVWEHLDGTIGIESYNIYKLENSQYQLLGNILHNDTTEFVDMTSLPGIHADKYVIASVDACGNIGAYSPYHQTMNLSIVEGSGDAISLIWTKYIDEAGINNPSEYEIYRGTGNLEYFSSITGGLSDYNYNIPTTLVNERFVIMIQRPNGCAPLNNNNRASGGPYYQASSNIEDEGVTNTSIASLAVTKLEIYPNPMKTTTVIKSDNKIEKIKIYSITGELIRELSHINTYEYKLEKRDLSVGSYIIEINNSTHHKLIIE